MGDQKERKELNELVSKFIKTGRKAKKCFVCNRSLDQMQTGSPLYHCWWCGIEYFEKFNDLGSSVGFFIYESDINIQACRHAVNDIDLATNLLRSKFRKEKGGIVRIDKPSDFDSIDTK